MAFLLSGACATPPPVPPPPLLSTAVDIERLVPPPPAPAPGRDQLERYPNIPIDEGVCPGKPAGVLVSDGKFSDLVEMAIDRNRLLITTKVYRELRSKEWESFRRVEQIHLEYITQLEHERQRQLRLAPWRLWGGFALGAGVMLAASWAAGRAQR